LIDGTDLDRLDPVLKSVFVVQVVLKEESDILLNLLVVDNEGL